MKVKSTKRVNSRIKIGTPCYFLMDESETHSLRNQITGVFTNKELEDIRSCIMIGEGFGRHAVMAGKGLLQNLSPNDRGSSG